MSATAADVTAPEQQDRVVGRPFLPGQSGNPAGRPRGARSILSEDFLAAALKSFEAGGQKALNQMMVDEPGKFCTMIAGLLPRQIKADINDKRLLIVELIGQPEFDPEEDVTSGGVRRPELIEHEQPSNGHDTSNGHARPRMPAFDVIDEDEE